MNTIPVEISNAWSEYELLDCGNGRKLERFGNHIISRPDSQAFWKPLLPETEWQKAHAVFEKQDEKGIWNHGSNPTVWNLSLDNLVCQLRLTPFGHTGIFPEQYHQWHWIEKKIKESPKQLQVLSLFGYTGIATLFAAAIGAKVTHVDASKPSVAWASENLRLSNLSDKPVRWIVDDALKFVKRELKRNNTYDAIIMDPPKFGRGPQGEVWKFEDSFPKLLQNCKELLTDDASFVLVNAYAIPISALTLGNVVRDIFKQGIVEYGELGLLETAGKRIISTSLFAKWFRN